MASVSSRAAPQRIGDFEVIRTLGTGSFGKVKLAKHVLTGHKVAMKFISKRKVSTAEMSDRVQREIQYLGMLQHPHIIKLYDVTQTPDSIVMIIEYLKGELFDYIVKTGRMAEHQARRFFQQIIAAVEYCHYNDIVHRDLKPENLLLDEQLNVKIADFGLSNVMRDGDFLRTSCGSPNYAAPEVISGRLYAGPEIDIWSCGVILYVMLCGRLPFDDDHIPMLFKKINGGIFSLPPYLSPGARHLLSKMLVVDSNKRITISEIRELPWFQESLPAYLSQPPKKDSTAKREGEKPSGSLSSIASGEISPNFADKFAPTEGSQWIDGVGYVEPEGIKELAVAMEEPEEDILEQLKDTTNKKVRIAYQLCADNYRAKLAAQQNSLDRNNSMMRRPSASAKDPSKRNAQATPSHIGMLPGTIPKQPQDYSLQKAKQSRNPLNAGRGLQSMTQTEAPRQQAITTKKQTKPRWHFGIRSRSPPLEVMLEIYRTLQTLGFEWKRKPEKDTCGDDTESNATLTEEEQRKKRRREEEERVKTGQALFFVEARCPLDDVMVYMDIQLYQVDEINFLVDFRNVGYRQIVRRSPRNPSGAPSDSGTESETGSYTLSAPKAAEVRSKLRAGASGTPTPSMAENGLQDMKSRPVPNLPQVIPKSTAGVNSPFLFLECACKLIIELAIGGSQ